MATAKRESDGGEGMAVTERRKLDRRFTDQEIEDILEYAKGYTNGAKKRQAILGISMAGLLAVSTLVNMWIVNPIREDMMQIRHEMLEIDQSVRKHHEEQASEYVSKKDEEKVYSELMSLEKKVDRIIAFLLDKSSR